MQNLQYAYKNKTTLLSRHKNMFYANVIYFINGK